MAVYTKAQLDSIISRVTDEVTKETSEARGFSVADLRASFSDLVKGGDTAWSISYTTAAAPALEQAGSIGRGGNVAWTISYSTASAELAAKSASR